MKDKIIDAYAHYVLENEQKPKTVYIFAKKLKISEAEFYNHFAAFESIENEFFNGLFEKTIEKLAADAVYLQYSAREKLLAFYFAWFEKMTQNRSFIRFIYEGNKTSHFSTPAGLESLKTSFIQYASGIVNEGVERGEIQERPYVTKKYAELMWAQTLFLLNFWIKDTSKGFEKTDAAIEKTVNLAFDLMAKSAVDTAFDWFKFVWQNK